MEKADTHTMRFGEVAFDLYHDPTYIPDAVARQFTVEQLEPELWRFLVRAVQPGATVVDGGANIGLFTLLMAKLVGPAGLVHAFEPHPDTLRRLDRNLGLNRATNVLAHPTALWDANRDLTLYTCFEPGLASLRPYDGWTGSRTVRTERLDRILPNPPWLIKLDVEGSELTALKGCETWLARVPYVAAEMSRTNLGYHGTTPELLATYMASYGKDLWFLANDGAAPRLIAQGAPWPQTKTNQMGLFAAAADVHALWETVDAA